MATSGTTRIHTDDHLSLVADWAIPDEPVAAAVLCHPHPLQGGNRTVTLIDSLFRRLPGSGIAALRFDFRGVGVSEGDHDEGVGEQLDVAAAVAEAGELGVPVWVVGWSFGAELALTATAEGVAGWIGIAPPLRILDGWPAAHDERPKLLLVPEHDQFNPPMRAQVSTASWVATTVDTVPNTDHFLAGRETWIGDRVEGRILGT